VSDGPGATSAGRALRLRLVSPARTVFEGEVRCVVLPAFDGEWGILANHAPIVAALAVGCLRLTALDGSGRAFAVRGGFAEVRDNVVTVLSPECLGPEEVSPAGVDAELAGLEGGDTSKSAGACRDRAARLAWGKACRIVLGGGKREGGA